MESFARRWPPGAAAVGSGEAVAEEAMAAVAAVATAAASTVRRVAGLLSVMAVGTPVLP
ncbi:hypothetical protein GCM10023079_22440 [Streptomyces chitinivorans]